MQILQPEGWAKPKGYANGVAAEGRLVFVAGQIGWDEGCVFRTDDFAEQTRQALRNVVAVLAEAGAEPHHVTRLTWYIVDRAEYHAAARAVGEAYRAVMGRHYPPMSMVEVRALMEDRARVEIEATAVVPLPDAHGRGG
ncbi:MAG TPA: RidA family protein [Alphaproteobacteria bacterium]|nr:RidA family protein [Alphaproteobacteria bacterium]